MSKLPLSLRIARKAGILDRVNLTRGAEIGGRRYRIPVTAGLGLHNLTGGAYDRWRAPLLDAALACPGVFLDVGANVGQTLLEVRARDPARAYVGCEPNPACAAYVDRLARANRLGEAAPCAIVPAGLTDADGLLTLDDSGEGSAVASAVPGFRPPAFYTHSRRVCGLRGDEVLDALDLGPLAAVKVDVEGGEPEALRGLTGTLRRDRPPVFCEILPVLEPGHDTDELHAFREGRQDRLLEHMRGLDYRLFRTAHDGTVVPLTEIARHADLALCDYLFLPAESADAFLAAAGVPVAPRSVAPAGATPGRGHAAERVGCDGQQRADGQPVGAGLRPVGGGQVGRGDDQPGPQQAPLDRRGGRREPPGRREHGGPGGPEAAERLPPQPRDLQQAPLPPHERRRPRRGRSSCSPLRSPATPPTAPSRRRPDRRSAAAGPTPERSNPSPPARPAGPTGSPSARTGPRWRCRRR